MHTEKNDAARWRGVPTTRKPSRLRDRQFNMRLTEEELAEIEKKVADSRKSRADFVMETARGVRVVRVDDGSVRDELMALRSELLRQGNNLNQIAYRLNRAAKLQDSETVLEAAGDIAEMIEDHRALAKEIGNAIRRTGR